MTILHPETFGNRAKLHEAQKEIAKQYEPATDALAEVEEGR